MTNRKDSGFGSGPDFLVTLLYTELGPEEGSLLPRASYLQAAKLTGPRQELPVERRHPVSPARIPG